MVDSDAPQRQRHSAVSTQPYFERQSLMRCAQHAINNLLQRPAVTHADLNAIVDSISSSSFSLQHRWPLLGNHDANVLMLAFAQHGCTAQFWDARRTTDDDIRELVMTRCREPGVVGLIVNVKTRSAWSLYVLPQRHWYAILRVDDRRFPEYGAFPGGWLELDSRAEKPRGLPENTHLHFLLQTALRDHAAEVLVVTRST